MSVAEPADFTATTPTDEAAAAAAAATTEAQMRLAAEDETSHIDLCAACTSPLIRYSFAPPSYDDANPSFEH